MRTRFLGLGGLVVGLAAFALFYLLYYDPGHVAHVESSPKSDRPDCGAVVTKELRFKDIHFKQRQLSEACFKDKKAFVFVAVNNGCPLAARYLPFLARIEKDYRKQGVQFIALNVGLDETILEMARQATDYNVDFPFVKDIEGNITRALGFERTPEVVVLDEKRTIRYRGRINDQYAPGKTLPQATREDLKQALDELLAGKEVSVRSTPCEGCKIAHPSDAPEDGSITYAEHVAPLIHDRCAHCHRPGGLAPFSLVTYEQVNKRGEMIAEVVQDGQMPPWYGSSHKAKVINDPSLTVEERNLIARWVKGGKPRGDEKKFPRRVVKPREENEWLFGEPDLIIKTPVESIPADGDVEYRLLVPEHFFREETYIQTLEIKPDNPAVVHHANLLYLSTYLPEFQLNEKMFVTGFVPGNVGMQLEKGIAYRLPPQTGLILQTHFVTTGKPETCSISIGIRFPRDTVRKTLKPMLLDLEHFKIPPHTPDHKIRIRDRVLPCDATGVAFFTHMHLLGKSMIFRATPPGGKQETVFSVPNFSFDWQLPYKLEEGGLNLPKGTVISVEATYDNSAFNSYNHDPSRVVRSGMQTRDEMLQGFFFYTDANEKLNLEVNPKTGIRKK